MNKKEPPEKGSSDDSITYHNHIISHKGEKIMATMFELTATLRQLLELAGSDDTARIVMEAETYHLKPTSQVLEGRKGKMLRTYIFMRGSHDYDTKEMTILLDGMIQEAQSVGIETLTPDQLAEMRAYEQRKEDRRANH